MTLKFIYTSTSITSMDLDKPVGQIPSNKSGLGYKKSSIIFMYPKKKENNSDGQIHKL
jgi:hypothetical protein